MFLRPGELSSHPFGWSGGEGDQCGGHLVGGHRLDVHAGDQGQRAAGARQELRREVVELRGPKHASGHRAVQDQLLLGTLALVVAEINPVDANDREGDVVACAGAPPCCQ